jgi:hypothetical protein
MLEIFDGRPGDGKTYSAMLKKILPHLAGGGFVATNIEVNPAGVAAWIKNRTGKIFQPDRLVSLDETDVPTFYRVVPRGSEDCQVLVVLDEAHLWFNSRDWKKNDDDFRETFNLATQHRKHWLDIILITQHFANIDSQFLRLTETIWRFRDLKKSPLWGVFQIPFLRFVANVYDRNGKKKVDWSAYPFEKLVGDTYNTRATLRGSSMAGEVQKIKLDLDPQTARKVQNVRKFVQLAIILFGVLLILIGYHYLKVVPERKEKQLALDKSERELQAARRQLEQEKQITLRQKEKQHQKPAQLPGQQLWRPDSWLASAPVYEVLTASSVCKVDGLIRLRVQLDGYQQWLQAGGYTSKGRTMAIHKLGHDVYDIDISDDKRERHRIRCIMQGIPSAGAGGAVAPVGGIRDNTNVITHDGKQLIE